MSKIKKPNTGSGEPIGPRTRNIGLRRIRVADIEENPFNFRTHPQSQRDAFAGTINEVGWFGYPDTYETSSGGVMLIDGHLRKSHLIEKYGPEATIEVNVTDFDEVEARKAMLTHDPLAAMAEMDAVELDKLLRSVETGDEALSKMLAGLADEAGLYKDGDEAEEQPTGDEPEEQPEFRGIWGLMDQVKLPSTNEWDLPDIRLDMCSDKIPLNVYNGKLCLNPVETMFIHGTAKFEKDRHAGGVLAFYTDDHRFESVWNEPVQVVANFVRFGWGAVCSPDFSLWRNDPLALQMWQTFRSRWLARYWQEAGVRVIPSLNWSDSRTHRWCFVGIPKQVPVVSLQCRTVRTKEEMSHFRQGISEGIRQLEPQNVLIYGGETNRTTIEPLLPDGPVYHWLSDWTSERRKVINMKKEVVGCGGGGRSSGGPRVGGRLIGPV